MPAARCSDKAKSQRIADSEKCGDRAGCERILNAAVERWVKQTYLSAAEDVTRLADKNVRATGCAFARLSMNYASRTISSASRL
jgi:hypothetical protein